MKDGLERSEVWWWVFFFFPNKAVFSYTLHSIPGNYAGSAFKIRPGSDHLITPPMVPL